MKTAFLVRSLAFVAALAIPVAGASAQFIPIDNFDDGDDKGWIRGYSHPEYPGEFDASSGCYHMGTTNQVPRDEFVTVGAAWAQSDSPAFSNGRLRVLVRADTASSNPGIAMRADSETGHSYVFVASSDTGQIYILRIAGPDQQQLAVGETSFRTGENWIFEVGAIGEDLSFRVWRANSFEPAAPQVTAIDSSYSHGRFSLAAAHPIPSVASQLSVCFDDVVFFPACPADFNLDGVPNSQDFFDFVAAFLSLEPRADFNNDAAINSQDFFDFLTAFFAGCP